MKKICICCLLLSVITSISFIVSGASNISEISIEEKLDFLVNNNLINENVNLQSNVNRAQLALYITKVNDLPITLGKSAYTDISLSSPYYPYINATLSYIPGYIEDGNKIFKPMNKANREDLIVCFSQLLNGSNLKGKLINHYTDSDSISSSFKQCFEVAEGLNIISSFNLCDGSTLNINKEITMKDLVNVMYYLKKSAEKNINDGKQILDISSTDISKTSKISAYVENGNLKVQWVPTNPDSFMCYHIQLHGDYNARIDKFNFSYPSANNTTTLYNCATNTWTYPNIKVGRCYKLRIVSVYKNKTYFSNTYKIIVKDPESKFY